MDVTNSILSLYKSGKYSDMSIICDDGTRILVHKMIVCDAVKAIGAGINSTFREGQTNEYHLPGKSPQVVKIFFDLMYGAKDSIEAELLETQTARGPADSGLDSDLVLAKEASMLKYAEIYAMADELQADQLMTYVLKQATKILHDDGNKKYNMLQAVDLSATLLYLEEYSARCHQFFEAVLPYLVQHREHLMSSTKAKSCETNDVAEFFLNDEKRRFLLLQQVVKQYPGVNECKLLFPSVGKGSLSKACELRTFAEKVILLWLAKEPVSLDELLEDQDVAQVCQDSGLSHDLLVTTFQNSLLRRPNFHLCDECCTIHIYECGKRPAYWATECSECGMKGVMTPIHSYYKIYDDGLSRRYQEGGKWQTICETIPGEDAPNKKRKTLF